MSFPEISAVLPHDAPMIVIDRIVAHDVDSVTTELVVDDRHMFFDQSANALPSWVVIEIMAQSVAASAGLIALQEDRPIIAGFLLGTRKLDLAESWIPVGACVRTRVASQFSAAEGLAAFNCETYVDDAVFASGIINVYQNPGESQST